MTPKAISPEKCAELISNAKNIVALSGAGVSTAAGIPDFRGPGGLYSSGRYDPDTVFDINYFGMNPRPFFDFSRDLFDILEKIKPTFTHRFLAELEKSGKLSAVITQNIDPLHQLAGSRKVIALHGNYAKSHCLKCGRPYMYAELKEMLKEDDVPYCDCDPKAVIKPDVVFFGEPVSAMEDGVRAAADSDLMLILGSSLVVYPAASLPAYAGGDIVVVNKGSASLNPAENRFFADTDLDSFFADVKKHM